VLVGRTPAIVLACQEARITTATPHTASAITTSEKIKTKQLAILCGFMHSHHHRDRDDQQSYRQVCADHPPHPHHGEVSPLTASRPSLR
jgi:hypothetical protein